MFCNIALLQLCLGCKVVVQWQQKLLAVLVPVYLFVFSYELQSQCSQYSSWHPFRPRLTYCIQVLDLMGSVVNYISPPEYHMLRARPQYATLPGRLLRHRMNRPLQVSGIMQWSASSPGSGLLVQHFYWHAPSHNNETVFTWSWFLALLPHYKWLLRSSSQNSHQALLFESMQVERAPILQGDGKPLSQSDGIPLPMMTTLPQKVVMQWGVQVFTVASEDY